MAVIRFLVEDLDAALEFYVATAFKDDAGACTGKSSGPRGPTRIRR